MRTVNNLLHFCTMNNISVNHETLQRRQQIAEDYFNLLDNHLDNIVSGRETEMMSLRQIAQKLYVSHKYLIEIIQEKYRHHPCYFYDKKILEKAKQLLSGTKLSVAEIARRLTYDPSNFSKFFKKYVGQTPMQFRSAL